MKTIWEYDLPTNENSSDFQYESPIFFKDNYVYYISGLLCQKTLHIVDMESGLGITEELVTKNHCLPSKYFFLEFQDTILIYAGDLFTYQKGVLAKTVDLSGKGEVKSYLVKENKLFFVCSQSKESLFCYNLETQKIDWQLNITNSKQYVAGELTLCDNLLACYGKDQLLFVETERGRIVDQIKIPRIEKLFCPIKVDEEHLIIGYTNWSNAGILKYDTVTKQVIWRHKRKFEGPQLKCKIYRHNDDIFWVKNDTELICLNIEDGSEKYQFRTNPWLYTNLQFIQDNMIYGTSGADGYINNVDPKTGMKKWSVFLKNGCAYYDVYENSIIVGDFNKEMKQISLENGSILQNYCVDGEVVGDIKVHKDCVYTVIWGSSEKEIRLVKIKI